MTVRPEFIQVTVNGERRDVPPQQSVSELLAFIGVGLDRVAVELNKSIVRKRDWDRVSISDGSQIEVVEFVGGG